LDLVAVENCSGMENIEFLLIEYEYEIGPGDVGVVCALQQRLF